MEEGSAPTTLTVNTFSNDGYFYFHVTGKNGAYDLNDAFAISIESEGTCGPIEPSVLQAPLVGSAGSTTPTVVVWDSSRIAGTSAEKGALATRLERLAPGAVVDVAGKPRVAALATQAAANPNCVYATNLVAAAIRDEVRAYTNSNLAYVVLVGGDSSVPFFRYPDTADELAPESWYVPPMASNTASEASLRSEYVLGQDEYGADTVLLLGGTRFPIPKLAVGRLVETAAEASAQLDAYLNADNSVKSLSPQTSLVTGYEFLTDSSEEVRDQLALGTGRTPDALINDTWTANDLRSKLITGPTDYDLVYLAGHFDAGAALAADNATAVNASELLAPGVDLMNSLVWSTGCHAGYNVVDGEVVPGVTQALDWAQALARKGATLVGGTGFQYGDDELVDYSERIYAEFTRQLRAGSGPVAVGDALVESKLAYLAASPEPKGLHQKALLTAAVFGLPMFSIDMPGVRDTTGGGGSIVPPLTSVGDAQYGQVSLDNADFQVPSLPASGPNGTTYYTGRDGVASNPGEPALPRYVANVDVPGKVLRGIGFWSGDFAEESGINPFTGAPGTEFGGDQTPFTSTTWFPARMWAASYFGELSGRSTNLVVTPVQHRVEQAGDATASRRLYDQLDLRLFYVDDTDPDAAAAGYPAISGVTGVEAAGTVTFEAVIAGTDVAGQDNVESAWVTFTFGSTGCSCWESVLLQPVPGDPTRWRAELPLDGRDPDDLRFIVQAANDAALVAREDNDNAYYALGGGTSADPDPSSLELGTTPESAAYGDDLEVSATLTDEADQGLAGRQVVFRVGTALVSDTTDASGLAEAIVPLTTTPGPQQVVATFGGDASFGASSDQEALTVTTVGAQLALTVPASALLGADPSGISAILTSAGAEPLGGQTIVFVVSGTPGSNTAGTGLTRAVTTDATGRGVLGGIPTLPVGPYTVTVYYNGQILVNPWAPAADQQTITLTSPIYSPATPASGPFKVLWPFTGFYSPVDNLPVLNQARAGSTIPVKFSLGGNRGLAILKGGYPKAVQITCPGGASVDVIEEVLTASTSSLAFDPVTNRYQYNWKSAKTMAGKCFQFQLGLIDGNTVPVADVKFK